MINAIICLIFLLYLLSFFEVSDAGGESGEVDYFIKMMLLAIEIDFALLQNTKFCFNIVEVEKN